MILKLAINTRMQKQVEGKNPKGNILCLNVVVYIYTYTYINVELCQVKDQPEAPL